MKDIVDLTLDEFEFSPSLFDRNMASVFTGWSGQKRATKHHAAISHMVEAGGKYADFRKKRSEVVWNKDDKEVKRKMLQSWVGRKKPNPRIVREIFIQDLIHNAGKAAREKRASKK